MPMLSIHSYFDIKDRNVGSGRLLKCGIIVSEDSIKLAKSFAFDNFHSYYKGF